LNAQFCDYIQPFFVFAYHKIQKILLRHFLQALQLIFVQFAGFGRIQYLYFHVAMVDFHQICKTEKPQVHHREAAGP
jgi:hypothetical protein